MSDNANNEGAREKEIEQWLGRDLERVKCMHHNLMLACKDVRKSCHKVTSEMIGKERDRNIQEFATNNIVDSIQIQLGKEFGHLNPYAFGHGAVDFPTWMRAEHPGKYIGLDRLVGNRSMVFLRNALVMNAMVPYYIEWLDFLVGRVGEYNRLQLKSEIKIGCAEVCIALTRMHVHTYSHTYTCTHIHMYTHIYAHTGVRVNQG